MTATFPALDPTKFDGCQFDDDLWVFYQAKRGIPSSRTIDWSEVRAAAPALALELKVAFTILGNSKAAGGLNKSAATLTSRVGAMRELVRWMSDSGMQSLASLDNGTVLEYLEQQRVLGPPTHRTITTTALDNTEEATTLKRRDNNRWYVTNVGLLKNLKVAAPGMIRFGFPYVPFTNTLGSMHKLQLQSRRGGFEPISHVAWIAIMHTAHVFVHICMSDIERLTEAIEAGHQRIGPRGGTRYLSKLRAAGNTLRASAFRFSDDNPFSGDWQDHYEKLVSDYGKRPRDEKEGVRSGSAHADLNHFHRYLLQLALGATAISIMGMTGMRVSEFLGLQVFTIDEEGNARYPADPPYCVALDLNKGDVNYEFIVLRGRVFKHQNEATGLETDWVSGYRLRDGEYQSLAALAATRYAKLSSRYRKKLMARDLYAASHLAVAHGDGGQGTWVSSRAINTAIRAFVRELVSEFAAELDVDDLDADRIHSHRFRSALANMLFFEDSSLLDDIRLQLKHYHHDMTFRAYVQRDLVALGITREATIRVYANTLAEYMEGFEGLGGGPARRFHAAAEEIAQGDPEIPLRDRIDDYVRNRNLTAVTQRDHGLCEFNPLNAKCLSGIPDLNRIAIPLPDENIAEEHTCMSCSNLLILPKSIPHLKRRLARLQESVAIAEKLGEHGQAEIHRIHAASIQRQLNAITRRTEAINDAAVQELERGFQN